MNKRTCLLVALIVVLVSPYFSVSVRAEEPTLTTILYNLGFTNITEVTDETFQAGTYEITLLAEFAGYHDQNELSRYEVNTSDFIVIFTGPEGNQGYTSPNITKSFTADDEFGLSMLSPEARYYTETARNPDAPVKHAKVYSNLDDPGMFLIGFENQLGGGDGDFNDMVFSLKPANHPPSIDGVNITPDPAYTTDTLTATPYGWSDPDGDPESYVYQWQKWDGAAWQNITGATGSTLGASNFVKGDQIKVICTPFDGTDYGTPKEDTITISNSPPTAPVVDVTPNSPVTTDDLTCTVTTPSTDPDGDPITYTYEWYKNSVLQPSETTVTTSLSDSVSSTKTSNGDVWKCVVTPNDGAVNGTSDEDQVTIGNSPPTQPVVDVTPDSPVTGDDLTCTVVTPSSDSDGDTVTYTYEWYKNSVLQPSETTVTTSLSDSVSSTKTSKGDVWKCIVTPNDGTVNGTSDDDQVTVGNSPPSIDGVNITPDPAYTMDTLTATPYGWYDPDGDPESYVYQWQKWDGVSWQNITGATGNTLGPSNFVKGDLIKVICWPVGSLGTPKEDTITISNTPPSIGGVGITPDPAYTTDTLAATPYGWSDPDSDPEGYVYQWQKYVGGTWQNITGATAQTLGSSNFVKGDQIKVICTPFDGTDYGTPKEDTITISNSPPSAPVVDVTPDSPVTGDNLTCTVTTPSSDPDGDTVTYTYEWYKDSVLQPGETTVTTALSDSVSSTKTSNGDVWKCVVTPNDGAVNGTSAEDQVAIGNSPPTQPVVDVTPDSPVTTDDLTCTVTNPSSDLDGDTVTYIYEWYKDMVLQPGETTITTALSDSVSSTKTAKGEIWKCVVTPNDGTVNGTPSEDQVTIGNSPPSIDGVNITPDPAYTTDTLTANPYGWYDPDGDPESYVYQWQKWDGAAWQNITGETGATLGSSNFVKGDLIKVICWPVGSLGTPKEDTITISNTPPSIGGVNITPDPAYTTDTLAATPYGWSDPDSDPEGYVFQWQKYVGVSWQNITGATAQTLGSSNFVKGDQIKVICTPFDGTDYGAPKEDTITVSNSPPSAPVVDVTPDSPVTTDDLVCTVTGPSSDPDGDTVTYTYEWYKNSVLQPGETTVTTALSDSVSSTKTAKGETWKCVVTPNDGTVNGTSAEDQVTVVEPSPAVLIIDPPSIVDLYGKGENFTVDIMVENITGLYSEYIGIQWDPTYLYCNSFDYVDDFLPDQAPQPLNYLDMAGSVNNVYGNTTVYSRSLTGSGNAGGCNGTGTLMRAEFHVLAYCPDGTWISFTDDTELLAYGAVKIDLPMQKCYFELNYPLLSAPVAEFTESPPPYYVNVTVISFDASGSSPGWNGTHSIPIANYTWDFSDGNVTTVTVPTITHIYTSEGVFDVYLTVMCEDDPTLIGAALTSDTAGPETKIVFPGYEPTGLDLYTETERFMEPPTDWIGEGPDMPADAYRPDENVTLYVDLIYNGDAVQSRLISFEVRDPYGDIVLVRAAMTNETGTATISFRIETVCGNPEYAFGKWSVLAKSTICDVPINDTLQFDVGWIIELTDVVPSQTKYAKGSHMSFTVYGENMALHDKNFTLTLVVYDDDGVPVANTVVDLQVPAGEPCLPNPFEIEVTCLEVPKWAYVGPAIVYANAFYELPSETGVSMCPEISNTFVIEAAP